MKSRNKFKKKNPQIFTQLENLINCISLYLYASSILFQQDFQQVRLYVEPLSKQVSTELRSLASTIIFSENVQKAKFKIKINRPHSK